MPRTSFYQIGSSGLISERCRQIAYIHMTIPHFNIINQQMILIQQNPDIINFRQNLDITNEFPSFDVSRPIYL